MTVNTQYDPDVGRPKKPPGEKYRTPPKSWKPPPELYERVMGKLEARGRTMTSLLVEALEKYDKENP